jgi:hypothetical protein
MDSRGKSKNELDQQGFSIIEKVFSDEEIYRIVSLIESKSSAFKKSHDVFAIRNLLDEVDSLRSLIFSSNLQKIIDQFPGNNYSVIKSIYFDKPEQSNWFVSYHQDLIIGVNKKIDLPGFDSWTNKQSYFGVQPPLEILKGIYTIRIHLDDTDENNGALKVIPGSHKKGIYRPQDIDWTKEKKDVCKVGKGGIMLMKPLLLHSSGRTTNNKRRRVIHIELSDQKLPEGLDWTENN